MTPYTLIVIDMQRGFDTALHKQTNHQIERQIKKAMALDCHIVFVRYTKFGLSNNNLTSLTSDYNRVHSVFKDEDDGSDSLEFKFQRKNIPNDNLVICGVNSRYCVSSTIIGLLAGDNKKRRIVVPVKACNCDLGYFPNKTKLPIWNNPFGRLNKYKRRVKLV